jgi:CHAT domain-containing protein/Tfp pilus assembly protein PilF
MKPAFQPCACTAWFVLATCAAFPAHAQQQSTDDSNLPKIVLGPVEGSPQLKEADELFTTALNSADSDEARSDTRQALEDALTGVGAAAPLDPDDPLVIKFLSLISDLDSRDTPPDSLQLQFQSLLEHSDAGECDPDERLAAEILAAAPQFSYAEIVLGDCYFQRRNWPEALKRYEQAEKIDPDYGRTYARVAECQDRLGNQSQALESYVHAVILSPGSTALNDSLASYAYGHSYKVLLHRVQRRARVFATAQGELEVQLDDMSGAPDEVSAAWLTFALKRLLLYADAAEHHPGHGLEPSFAIEQGSFNTLLDFWKEAQQQKPQLKDEDLDFLAQLRSENLLDAFLYTAYFRPEFADSYAAWRPDHEKEIRALFEKYVVVIDPDQVKFKEAMDLFASAHYEDALAAFNAAANGFIASRDPGIKEQLARCLNLMGRTARILGKTEEARADQTRAVEMLHDLKAMQQEAFALNSLALTETHTGDMDDALKHFQQALELDRKRHDVSDEVGVLTNLGTYYLTLGQTDQAQATLEDALAKSPTAAGALLSNLGAVSVALGQYAQGAKYYEQALVAARAEKDQLTVISVEQDLGDMDMQSGETARAMALFEDELADARGLKDRAAEAAALNEIGSFAMAGGDFAAARGALLRSWEIKKEINDRAGSAIALLNLGGISQESGDKSAALDYWKQALGVARELNQRNVQAAVLNDMSDSLPERRDQLSMLEEALSLLSAKPLTPSQDVPYPIPARQDILSVQDAQSVLHNLGVTLYEGGLADQGAGRQAEETADLRSAVSSLSLSADLLEDMRQGARPTDVETQSLQVSYMAQHFGTYETLVGAQLRLHQLEPAGHWDLDAFQAAERTKSRALLELLNESKVKIFAGVPDKELQSEKQFELQIGALETQVAVAQGDARDVLRGKLDRALADFDAFKKQLRDSYPRYAALKYAQPVSAAEVQELLDPGSALIEYFVGDDYLAAWLIRKQEVQVRVVEQPQPLLDRISAFTGALTHPISGFDPQAGQRLYQDLLAPFESSLSGVTRLIIVPDGALYKLPFEALVSGTVNNAPQFLVEKYAISYAQSSSVLVSLAGRAAPPSDRKPLLAMGRPAYATLSAAPEKPRSATEMAAVVKRGDSVSADLIAYYLGDRKLADLPGTEQEVESIGAILKSTDYIFTAADATEKRVKDYSNQGLLQSFRYIHFATHGLVSDELPALTSVVLAPDPSGQDDGFLTVGEVYGLALNSDLVTLSACGLGLGKMEKGEGVEGLTRAFLYAGTAAVNVSLWSVSDVKTVDLMKHFYENLAAGMSEDRALQQAQIAMIRSDQGSAGQARGIQIESGSSRPAVNPVYDWAPFVLYGWTK